MRVLIVGLGSIGRRHLANVQSLLPDAEIAVLRRRGGLHEPAPTGVQVVRSLEEAVQFRPRAAVIASPASLHISDALALARHGVHVLVEKPLADTLEGVDELVNLCTQGRVTLMVAYNLRFYVPLQMLRESLLRGDIGRVQYIRAEVGQYLPDWRPGSDYRQGVSGNRQAGGGAILELSHEIDYVRWLCGEVAQVCAMADRLSDLEIDVEDTAEIIMRFAGGAIGSVHLDMVQRPKSRGCRIIGSEGTLTWDGETHRVQLWTTRTGAWRDLHAAMALERNLTFLAELMHFFSCVRGEAAPSPDAADGRRVLEIALAIKESATLGRPVNLCRAEPTR